MAPRTTIELNVSVALGNASKKSRKCKHPGKPCQAKKEDGSMCGTRIPEYNTLTYAQPCCHVCDTRFIRQGKKHPVFVSQAPVP